MKKRRIYRHIDEQGMKLMESVSPGSLLRVSWIEEIETEECLLGEENYILFSDEVSEETNIVMLIEWKPQIINAENIICFNCLYKDRLYNSSTAALLEVLKTTSV